MTPEEANSFLPQKPHRIEATPDSLVYTIIAEPKFGKTTWACSIPDALLLAAERGHSFVEAFKIELTAWDYNVPSSQKPQPSQDDDGLLYMSFMQAVDVITASDRFRTVIIDTADMLGKMCMDFHLKKNNLVHPQDWDFGKGHEVCLNQPFRQAMGRIIKSGRGIVFITHTATTDARFAGTTKSKKECTLPSGMSKFIIPQSDVILHGRFGPKDPVTKRRTRIFQTEGSDEVLAGGRMSRMVPPKFIIDHDHPWQQWAEFFTNPESVQEAMAQYDSLVRAPRAAQDQEAAETMAPAVVKKEKKKPQAA
jgi:hypothetical protein